MNHLKYLEEMGMAASEWEKFVNDVAQELIVILRKRECTYYDGKAAIRKANSILEQATLMAKV